ncbi:hypothetical protein QJS04_geneDACA005990 [Acorus gramineus]|uniref:Uncharacterized protein n=1 Tax=Acorus gramineus TaxID=55184 RepID=A0AAV9B767_ACOGR|nr:hypothetical protein QJS04_geneDACA005990 [Acorus gramineus]
MMFHRLNPDSPPQSLPKKRNPNPNPIASPTSSTPICSYRRSRPRPRLHLLLPAPRMSSSRWHRQRPPSLAPPPAPPLPQPPRHHHLHQQTMTTTTTTSPPPPTNDDDNHHDNAPPISPSSRSAPLAAPSTGPESDHQVPNQTLFQGDHLRAHRTTKNPKKHQTQAFQELGMLKVPYQISEELSSLDSQPSKNLRGL